MEKIVIPKPKTKETVKPNPFNPSIKPKTITKA